MTGDSLALAVAVVLGGGGSGGALGGALACLLVDGRQRGLSARASLAAVWRDRAADDTGEVMTRE